MIMYPKPHSMDFMGIIGLGRKGLGVWGSGSRGLGFT